MKCSGCDRDFDASALVQQLPVPACPDCEEGYMRHEEAESNKCADIAAQDEPGFGQ